MQFALKKTKVKAGLFSVENTVENQKSTTTKNSGNADK